VDMKKFLAMFLSINVALFAQEFVVENVSGKVNILRGTEEEFRIVEKGNILYGDDLLITEEKSTVRLSRDGAYFILQDNSALGLSHIKKLSINDLLLKLAMEEIKNVPKSKQGSSVRNTAVYGSKVNPVDEKEIIKDKLGLRMLNGAKQLAESGYKESAIVVAKETFRKHPATRNSFNDRLYFTKILEELGLYEEAIQEYSRIKKLTLTSDQINQIEKKMEELNLKVLSD